MLGALSDSIGRRQVIFVSLLISMGGCVLLGYSTTFIEMLASRIITGAGFQIALFRAYFATTQPKEKRTGSLSRAHTPNPSPSRDRDRNPSPDQAASA